MSKKIIFETDDLIYQKLDKLRESEKTTLRQLMHQAIILLLKDKKK